jgi:hypothetical protein
MWTSRQLQYRLRALRREYRISRRTGLRVVRLTCSASRAGRAGTTTSPVERLEPKSARVVSQVQRSEPVVAAVPGDRNRERPGRSLDGGQGSVDRARGRPAVHLRPRSYGRFLRRRRVLPAMWRRLLRGALAPEPVRVRPVPARAQQEPEPPLVPRGLDMSQTPQLWIRVIPLRTGTAEPTGEQDLLPCPGEWNPTQSSRSSATDSGIRSRPPGLQQTATRGCLPAGSSPDGKPKRVNQRNCCAYRFSKYPAACSGRYSKRSRISARTSKTSSTLAARQADHRRTASPRLPEPQSRLCSQPAPAARSTTSTDTSRRPSARRCSHRP